MDVFLNIPGHLEFQLNYKESVYGFESELTYCDDKVLLSELVLFISYSTGLLLLLSSKNALPILMCYTSYNDLLFFFIVSSYAVY